VKLEATGVTDRDDYNPQITAVGISGEYVVTYQGTDSNGDDSIFVQKFGSDSRPQGTQVMLESTGITNRMDNNPQITAVGTSGEYVVAYQGTDSDRDSSIFVQKFNSDGTTEGSQVKLKATGVTYNNGVTYNGAYEPQIAAVGTSGEYVVTYNGIDSGGDSSIFVQKFNNDGTPKGSQVMLEAMRVTNKSDDKPQITAIGTSGEFVVAYNGYDSEDNMSIFVQKFDSDGTPKGSEVKLPNGWQYYEHHVAEVGTNGEFAITYWGYNSNGDLSIFVQKFGNDGTTQGSQIKLATVVTDDMMLGWGSATSQIAAVGTNGEFVVTYRVVDSDGDDRIFVQKCNSDGTPKGSQVKLEATGVTNGDYYAPQITAVGTSGEYVVTYYGNDRGDNSIFVQKFNANGTTQERQVMLEATGVTDQHDYVPHITAVGTSGEFVVAYSGVDSDGDYSIFVQKFNADGTVAPIALDINKNGDIDYGYIDLTFDDITYHSAWVDNGDGVLVWDKYADGQLHDMSQYIFAKDGLTDLGGLALDFDTNKDNHFDINDDLFKEFGVFVDGEILSLAEVGITSIDLVSDGVTQVINSDVTEYGRAYATLANGEEMLLSDAAFGYTVI